MEIKHRQATQEELMTFLEKEHGKTTVRHFIKEQLCSRAFNGVRHVQRSKVPVEIDATGCYCILHGTREKITASVAYSDTIKPIIYDVRLDNQYLPKHPA